MRKKIAILGFLIVAIAIAVLFFCPSQKFFTDKPLKLHLGCGSDHLPGYINVAASDVMTLGFPKGSVEEIRLHRGISQYTPIETLALLAHCHEWLKVGGSVFIEDGKPVERALQAFGFEIIMEGSDPSSSIMTAKKKKEFSRKELIGIGEELIKESFQ